MKRKKKTAVDFKKAINMEMPTEYYVALLLGLFFLFTAVHRLLNLPDCAQMVFGWHVLSWPLVNGAALLLVGLELSAAFAVVFMKEWRRAGLWILVVLLLVYTAVAGFNLWRGVNTAGVFFGFDPRTAALNHWTLVRTLGAAAAGLFALRR